jgi:hypothetical protein
VDAGSGEGGAGELLGVQTKRSAERGVAEEGKSTGNGLRGELVTIAIHVAVRVSVLGLLPLLDGVVKLAKRSMSLLCKRVTLTFNFVRSMCVTSCLNGCGHLREFERT